VLLQEYSITRAQWTQHRPAQPTFDLVGDASRPGAAALDHEAREEHA
jgi:hypothetical protein